jgi:hypothetical protein
MRYVQNSNYRRKNLKNFRNELKADNELNSQEYEKHILELQSKSSEVTENHFQLLNKVK